MRSNSNILSRVYAAFSIFSTAASVTHFKQILSLDLWSTQQNQRSPFLQHTEHIDRNNALIGLCYFFIGRGNVVSRMNMYPTLHGSNILQKRDDSYAIYVLHINKLGRPFLRAYFTDSGCATSIFWQIFGGTNMHIFPSDFVHARGQNHGEA